MTEGDTLNKRAIDLAKCAVDSLSRERGLDGWAVTISCASPSEVFVRVDIFADGASWGPDHIEWDASEVSLEEAESQLWAELPLNTPETP